MAKKIEPQEHLIANIVARAQDPECAELYINHAQFVVSTNEVFVDLFFIAPDPKKPGTVNAIHKQRLILPHSIVKGFATGLANAVAHFETDLKITIPNQREPQPEDKITIWSQDEPNTAL